MSSRDSAYWAAKANRHARNAKIAFYVACGAAAVAVINLILELLGVYCR